MFLRVASETNPCPWPHALRLLGGEVVRPVRRLDVGEAMRREGDATPSLGMRRARRPGGNADSALGDSGRTASADGSARNTPR